MCGFATAFFMMQSNRFYSASSEDDLLYPVNVGESYKFKSMVLQYYMMLGAIENINLDSKTVEGEVIITVFFVLTTFIVQITILNMLIAIMSSTFDDHMREQDEQSKKQKLLLLSEYIGFIEFYMNKCCRCLKKPNSLFVVIVTPQILEGEDDDGLYDGCDSEISSLSR